ncbi:MAG: tRNA (adenosine(37)-N6)-threonylcarbamoyltransferase complex ATPase subunit type 1 TsaE [Magnetovibrio sp.]|nr:tRNA (adenosine(37)-N6)-threonylcarbamoyltransferase complex ATPase subunit type 1 TsaE [Magnetovibrio sp.]
MISPPESVVIELAGLPATRELAECLARIVKPGDILALYGDLGVGKSQMARWFIRALTNETEEVPSPTFTLLQTYESDVGDICHFDLYRLERAEDAFELGIEDAFHDSISIIEWPDRLGPYLPRNRLDIHLKVTKGKNHRQAILTPHANWSERLRDCGHG